MSHRPAARPRILIVPLVLLLSGLASCGVEHQGNSAAVRERLITPEPTELFDPAKALIEEKEIRMWDVEEGDLPAGWTTHDLQQGATEFTGRFFKVTGGSPHMQLAVDFGAEEVEFIDVDVSGSPSAIVSLSWETEGEPEGASPRRRVEARSVGRPHRYYRFDVFAHPAWKGRIRALRVHLAHTAHPLRLAYVRASRRVAPDERLAAALARPWKVDLGREVRRALLAPPGLALDFPVTGAPGPRTLSFAYGVHPAVGESIEFQILLETPKQRSTLFRRELEPGDRWHTARVDLKLFKGSAKLVLLTRAARSLDLLWGFPVWASLEIAGPRQADTAPNIILVSADTLRADHMSLYGYPRATSPRIAAWAESKGVLFEDAVAPAPWTLPSHASLFTGLECLSHDVHIEEAISPRLGFFTEHLQAAGYTTVAITGGGYVTPQYGFSRGFDVYRYWDQPSGEIETGTARLLESLEALPRPFFVFFHTYEVHSPYRARSPYYESFLASGDVNAGDRPIVQQSITMNRKDDYKARHWFGRTDAEGRPAGSLETSELPDLVARYDSGVAYLDEHLGRLFDAVEASPELRRNTAVILTSDHGEALGEKGLGGHASLYDFVLRIPLVISLPGGRRAGTKIEQQVRLIDLAPTLLELAGTAAPPTFDGTTLVPLMEGRTTEFPGEAWSYAGSSNYGMSLRVAGRMKYIFSDTMWPSSEEREELYDLAADSTESRNVVHGFPDLAALRQQVRQRFEAQAKGLAATISNSGDTILQGSMHSNAFLITNVKTWIEGCDCMEWNSRTLNYRLPPGSELRFLIRDIPYREPIRINARYGEEAAAASRFSTVFVPDDFDDDWTMVLLEDGWRETNEPVADAPRARFRFSWSNVPAGDGPEVAVSEELLEQLRALGYVGD